MLKFVFQMEIQRDSEIFHHVHPQIIHFIRLTPIIS